MPSRRLACRLVSGLRGILASLKVLSRLNRLMGLLASMAVVRRRLDMLLSRLMSLWTRVLVRKLLGRQMSLVANILVVSRRILVILRKLLNGADLLPDGLIVLSRLGVLLAFLTGMLVRLRMIPGRPRDMLASGIGE